MLLCGVTRLSSHPDACPLVAEPSQNLVSRSVEMKLFMQRAICFWRQKPKAARYSSVHERRQLMYSSPRWICSEKAALQALKASDWNLEGAFEVFYNQPPARPATDPRHLEELYVRYKGQFSIEILQLTGSELAKAW